MKLPRMRNFKTKNSSMINSIHFISDFKNETLFVEFKNGGLYSYDKVSFKVYKDLKKANRKRESVGSLFHNLVKSQDYEYKKVDYLARFV